MLSRFISIATFRDSLSWLSCREYTSVLEVSSLGQRESSRRNTEFSQNSQIRDIDITTIIRYYSSNY
jgi:hypothetical protein